MRIIKSSATIKEVLVLCKSCGAQLAVLPEDAIDLGFSGDGNWIKFQCPSCSDWIVLSHSMFPDHWIKLAARLKSNRDVQG